jgi:hypothetical protein
VAEALTVNARSWTGRIVPLRGAPTPVAGLWVGCHPDGGYAIVHEGSGCVVGSGYDDAEAALAAATEVGPLADWSASGSEGQMPLPIAVIERIDAIVKRWGGDGVAIKRQAATSRTAVAGLTRSPEEGPQS